MANSRVVRGALVVMTLLIVLMIGVSIAGHIQAATGDEPTYVDRAEAYCEQVYGDPSVGHSNAVISGGLHCTANMGDGPHLHEIPDEYKQQAYRASQNRTDLGWSPKTARQHAAETESQWVRYARFLTIHLALTVLVVGLIATYGRDSDA